ncbi:MAG: ABC transporter permease subunit [Bacteroidetes bacterium]|nr:ABC transporter permease subunit [Bacteroidota bacterium]
MRILKKCAIYISISVITILLIFPFLWMVSTAFKDKSEIFSVVPRLIPRKISFENFRSMWIDSRFHIYFLNSSIVAISTTVVSIIFSTFLAYGISRFKFRGRKIVFNLMLFTQMFPLSLLIITIYIVFIKIKLYDSLIGLVVAYCTFAIPFATMMLKAYFDGLPVELEEAAAIDGCTPISTIFRIVIPLSAPGIVAMGLFAFILAWQEFMIALTLIRTTEMRTLPVAITMMVGMREVFWGPLMAGTTVTTIPVVILFIYFQKYMISGMTMGAVKE